MDAFRTMILQAADAPLARQIAETLSPVGGSNMWIQGLSADGASPATHYISTGLIGPDFAAIMPLQIWSQDDDGDWVLEDIIPGQPEFVVEGCAAADPPLVVTEAEVQGLMDRADVTEQPPFTAMERLGLKIISEESP